MFPRYSVRVSSPDPEATSGKIVHPLAVSSYDGPFHAGPSRNTRIIGGNGPGIVTTFRPAVSSYDARDARKVRRALRETAEDGLGRVAKVESESRE